MATVACPPRVNRGRTVHSHTAHQLLAGTLFAIVGVKAREHHIEWAAVAAVAAGFGTLAMGVTGAVKNVIDIYWRWKDRGSKRDLSHLS